MISLSVGCGVNSVVFICSLLTGLRGGLYDLCWMQSDKRFMTRYFLLLFIVIFCLNDKIHTVCEFAASMPVFTSQRHFCSNEKVIKRKTGRRHLDLCTWLFVVMSEAAKSSNERMSGQAVTKRSRQAFMLYKELHEKFISSLSLCCRQQMGKQTIGTQAQQHTCMYSSFDSTVSVLCVCCLSNHTGFGMNQWLSEIVYAKYNEQTLFWM